jgi:hypothetical protein
MLQFGDDTYGEERAAEKLFRCIPEKYKQIACSIESLLDLSMMSIEEAIGRLKVVDGDEPQPLSGPQRGQAHVTQVEEEPALLLAHASIELSPATSAAAALLHLDEPRAHALLGDGSSSDKTDGSTGVLH